MFTSPLAARECWNSVNARCSGLWRIVPCTAAPGELSYRLKCHLHKYCFTNRVIITWNCLQYLSLSYLQTMLTLFKNRLDDNCLVSTSLEGPSLTSKFLFYNPILGSFIFISCLLFTLQLSELQFSITLTLWNGSR